MRIKELPNVLALHLKRFKYMDSLGRFKKLSYRNRISHLRAQVSINHLQ